jgi:hypothetical protein
LNTKNETKVNDPYACAGSSRPLSRWLITERSGKHTI